MTKCLFAEWIVIIILFIAINSPVEPHLGPSPPIPKPIFWIGLGCLVIVAVAARLMPPMLKYIVSPNSLKMTWDLWLYWLITKLAYTILSAWYLNPQHIHEYGVVYLLPGILALVKSVDYFVHLGLASFQLKYGEKTSWKPLVRSLKQVWQCFKLLFAYLTRFFRACLIRILGLNPITLFRTQCFSWFTTSFAYLTSTFGLNNTTRATDIEAQTPTVDEPADSAGETRSHPSSFKLQSRSNSTMPGEL